VNFNAYFTRKILVKIRMFLALTAFHERQGRREFPVWT